MENAIVPFVSALRTSHQLPKMYCASCHTPCGDYLQVLRFNKDKPEEASGRCLHGADQNTVQDPGCNGKCITPEGKAADPQTSAALACSMVCRYSSQARIRFPSKDLKAIGVAPDKKVQIFCDMAKTVTCSEISAAAQRQCRAKGTLDCPQKSCAVKKTAKCVKICKVRPSWIELKARLMPKLRAWKKQHRQLLRRDKKRRVKQEQDKQRKAPLKRQREHNRRRLRNLKRHLKYRTHVMQRARRVVRKYRSQAGRPDLANCVEHCSNKYCQFTVTMR